MKNLPLQRASIEPRLDGIQRDLVLLERYSELAFKEFNDPVILDRTHLRLRFVLEGIYHIGAHILSRIPGGRFTEYREIAQKLGEYGIVPREFAQQKLVPMAGYRNRLTHLYAQVSVEELHEILKNHLGDVVFFIKRIKDVLEAPEKFGLTIE